MKDRIILSLPIESDLAHRARVAAATLNISRVELIRRAIGDFIKPYQPASVTANHEPAKEAAHVARVG